MGQLELGLDKVEKTVDSEGTLRCALRSGLITGDTLESLLEQARLQGLLTKTEAEELEDMERLRGQIIGVDSFRPKGIKPSQRLKTQEDRHKKAAPFSLRTSGAGG